MANPKFEPFQGVTLTGQLADGTTIEFPNVEIEIRAMARPMTLDTDAYSTFAMEASERVTLHVKPATGGILYRLIQAQEEITLEDLYDERY